MKTWNTWKWSCSWCYSAVYCC